MKDNSNAIKLAISRVNTIRKRYSEYLPLSDKEVKSLEKKYRDEEVFASNHIEGNTYSLDETEFLLATGIPSIGKKLKESMEIQNLERAIEYTNKYIKESRSLSEELIKELHLVTVRGTLDDYLDEGNYKRTRNWVNDVNTSSPQATPVHMKKLLIWYKEEEEKERNILELATEFIYKFICIHPFTDGNGRVSRLIFNYILVQKGFVPVTILPEGREGYYKCLKECDKTNYKILIVFLCNCLVKTYERRIESLQ